MQTAAHQAYTYQHMVFTPKMKGDLCVSQKYQ